MTRPTPPRPLTPQHRAGIPDGAVVGLLAVLLGSVAMVWTATGLAAVLTRGTWPRHLPFTRSAQAIRHMATAPHDLAGAWAPHAGTGPAPDPLPSATAFWWTSLLLAAALTAAMLAALALRTSLRRPAARLHPGPRHPQDVDKPPIDPIDPAVRAEPAVPALPSLPPPRTAAAGTLNPASAAGQESKPEPSSAHPLSFPALLLRAAAIRPRPDAGLAQPGARGAPNPLAYGVALGHDARTGIPLYAAFDRGHCVFVPPGAARTKGPLLIHPAIAHAPGPVLATCSGPAAWQATAATRQASGPVRVFDPLRLTAADVAQRLRWAPHFGCQDPVTAAARAEALLHPVAPPYGSGRGAAVHAAARTLLRCWLHAAALDDRPFRQVHRWASGHGLPEAVRILRTGRGAADGWNGELETALAPRGRGPSELRDAALGLVQRTFAALEELHVLHACTPPSSERFEMESFLSERGTLYLVSEPVETPRQRPGAMPLLTALAQHMVEQGRRLAVRSSTGRLDPPLLAVLDDVAAIAPLPALPDAVARAGRQGVACIAVLRSPEQAKARWDDRAAHRLWTAAATCTVLGPAEPDFVQMLTTAAIGGHPDTAVQRTQPYGVYANEALVLHSGTATTVRLQGTY